jgi:hypothetical protein
LVRQQSFDFLLSQLYSIPTGKMVESTDTGNDTAVVTSTNGATTKARFSNAANITPQLVAGIKSSTSLGDILVGMNISESFAVGEVAVQSPPAVAMYISTVTSATSADAASKAATGVAQGTNNAATTANTTMQHQKNAIGAGYFPAAPAPAAVAPIPIAAGTKATRANFDQVIQAITGLENFSDFFSTATAAQTSLVYSTLQNQKVIQ